MPELIVPDVRVRESFLDAMAEFRAERRGGPDDNSMVGEEIREFGASWSTPRGFAAYIDVLRANARGEQVPAGFVACTTLWWAESDIYLGRIAIRHELTSRLLEVGGHIGYDVRPTARRRGHATAMLRAALPVAHRLGIDAALITCDADNVASCKVIESCGGVLEDQRGHKLRYWATTSGTSATVPSMGDDRDEAPQERPATWENEVVGEAKELLGRAIGDKELAEQGEDQVEIAHEVREEYDEHEKDHG